MKGEKAMKKKIERISRRLERTDDFGARIARKNEIYKLQLRIKATGAEKIALKILERLKTRFIFQKGFFLLKGKYQGYHCIVDFYIPMIKLAIEIDGGYHDSAEQRRKDKFKDKMLLEKREVKVLRIKNDEVEQLIPMICETLKESRWSRFMQKRKWLDSLAGKNPQRGT